MPKFPRWPLAAPKRRVLLRIRHHLPNFIKKQGNQKGAHNHPGHAGEKMWEL